MEKSKQVILLLSNNELSEIEVKKIPFSVAIKILRHKLNKRGKRCLQGKLLGIEEIIWRKHITKKNCKIS